MLYPVISKVPAKYADYHGKEKKKALSDYARTALKKSALLGSYHLVDTKKDKNGAPLPCNGVYWSISHKPLYVAAVCSRSPIGIDIEEICPRSTLLYGKIATDKEWSAFGSRSWDVFYRLFTAKESVLKASGIGLKGLQRCKVTHVNDTDNLTVDFSGKRWTVFHFRTDSHIASLTSDICDIEWTVIADPHIS